MAMSVQAAGAYLRERREARDLSRAKVARVLKTSQSQIERIDNGDIDSRSALFLGYARLVGANMRTPIPAPPTATIPAATPHPVWAKTIRATDVYVQPRESSALAGTLADQTLVAVIGQSAAWAHIRTVTTGLEGWVPQRVLDLPSPVYQTVPTVIP